MVRRVTLPPSIKEIPTVSLSAAKLTTVIHERSLTPEELQRLKFKWNDGNWVTHSAEVKYQTIVYSLMQPGKNVEFVENLYVTLLSGRTVEVHPSRTWSKRHFVSGNRTPVPNTAQITRILAVPRYAYGGKLFESMLVHEGKKIGLRYEWTEGKIEVFRKQAYPRFIAAINKAGTRKKTAPAVEKAEERLRFNKTERFLTAAEVRRVQVTPDGLFLPAARGKRLRVWRASDWTRQHFVDPCTGKPIPDDAEIQAEKLVDERNHQRHTYVWLRDPKTAIPVVTKEAFLHRKRVSFFAAKPKPAPDVEKPDNPNKAELSL